MTDDELDLFVESFQSSLTFPGSFRAAFSPQLAPILSLNVLQL